MKAVRLFLATVISLVVVVVALFAIAKYRLDAGLSSFSQPRATATPELVLTERDVENAQNLKAVLARRFSWYDVTEVLTHEDAVVIAAFVGSPVRNRAQTAQALLDATQSILGGVTAMRVILGDDSGQITQYDWSILTDTWRVSDG